MLTGHSLSAPRCTLRIGTRLTVLRLASGGKALRGPESSRSAASTSPKSMHEGALQGARQRVHREPSRPARRATRGWRMTALTSLGSSNRLQGWVPSAVVEPTLGGGPIEFCYVG